MRTAICLALALALTGCSTGRVATPPPANPSDVVVVREESRHVAADEAEAPAMAPPSPASGHGWRADRAPAPEPVAPPSMTSRPPRIEERRERPGLATQWGEERTSRVFDVEFERAGDDPLAVATLWYNDRGGVEAMASRAARSTMRLDAPVPIRGGVAFSVIDEAGAPLDAVSVDGRIYVVGAAGRRYSILLRNNTGRRYEAVLSVDGLDVIDGRSAGLEKRGYVLPPWGSLVVDGFRRNHDQVAAFRFGAVSSSYAARTGSDRNVGVIGLALFDERGATPWPIDDEEIDRRHTARPFSDARFAQPPR